MFAFNRFTLSTATFIYQNKLNKARTLRDTNAAFIRRGTPLISRGILTSPDSTDRTSFVLKPVYQFISGTEVSAVPYWSGDSSKATTDSANPIASTWRQAVAVDPTGRLQPGDSVRLPVSNEGYKWCKVVPLSAFYWIRITKEDSIAFTQFGASNGDFIGLANDTSFQAVIQAVRPGRIGLLMAMHVTGRKIANWTWQSYWWAMNPQDAQFGNDRPSTIPAPWNHYNMTVAYYMMRNDGTQNIAYNPYLESSLSGYLPKAGGKPTDSTFWTGATTNCMACHRRASVGLIRIRTPTPSTPPARSTAMTCKCTPARGSSSRRGCQACLNGFRFYYGFSLVRRDPRGRDAQEARPDPIGAGRRYPCALISAHVQTAHRLSRDPRFHARRSSRACSTSPSEWGGEVRPRSRSPEKRSR